MRNCGSQQRSSPGMRHLKHKITSFRNSRWIFFVLHLKSLYVKVTKTATELYKGNHFTSNYGVSSIIYNNIKVILYNQLWTDVKYWATVETEKMGKTG